MIATATGSTISGASFNNATLGGNNTHITSSSNSAILGGSSHNIQNGCTECVILGGGIMTIDSSVYSTTTAGNDCKITESTSSFAIGEGNRIGDIGSGVSNCFVGGQHAYADHTGCFVWGDSSTVGQETKSTGQYQFVVSARGGTTFYSDAAKSTGATLASGASAWGVVSDRNKKENLVELNYNDILGKVNQLPIYQYNYIGTDASLLCRGPVAQDWHTLFPSSKDPLKIDTMDLDGISLAAIKALSEKVQQQEVQILELKRVIDLLNKK